MITARLFAAASDAAGTESVQLEHAGSTTTVVEVSGMLTDQFGGELGRVLERCTFLVNGERVDAAHPVADGDTFDVLPPFAGG